MSGVAPEFRWRREWPWAVALASIGIATRTILALHPGSYCDGDSALFGLMARAIWRGEGLPVFAWGVAYVSSLATYVMAVFYGMLGADFTGVYAAHAVVYAIGVPPVYRLAHALGGRWGAAAALIALGLGTQALFNTAAMLGVFEILPIAAWVFLRLDRAAVLGVEPREGLLIGFLLSFGYWVHPLFVAAIGASAAALLALSPLRLRLQSAELAERLGPRRACFVRVALAVLGVALAGAVALTVSGSFDATVLGLRVSAHRAPRYAVRLGAALGAVWVLAELAIARRPTVLLCAIAGVVLAQLPLVGYLLADGERVHHLPSEFGGEFIARNADELPPRICTVVLGGSMSSSEPWRWCGAALGLLVALAALRCGVTLARTAWDIVRLRPARIHLGGLVALQVVVVLAAGLIHEKRIEERYLVNLWLPYVAALAAVTGAAASRIGRGAAVGVLVLIAVHHGHELRCVIAEETRAERDVRPKYRQLERSLQARGATLGYAFYNEAYVATYLSDERIRLSCLGGWMPRAIAIREAAALEPEPVAVYIDHRDWELRESLEVISHSVLERWRGGSFTVIRVRRPCERKGWIDELQGLPWRG